MIQKLIWPGPLEVHAPGDLREPEVQAAEDREDRRAEDDVVEVGDHEVGVGHLLVERHRQEHDPGQAAGDEHEDEAGDEQERRPELGAAGHERHAPGEDLDRRRDHDHRRWRRRRTISEIVGSPVANMWWAHTPKPMNTTSSSAIATSGNATILRRVNVGMIVVAMPNAGTIRM